MSGGDRTSDEEANVREGESAGVTAEPSRDVIFDVLRSERRRAALRHLDTTDGAVSLSGLGAVVCATERHVDVSPSRRRHVEVSLHQVHLPKLDDVDVVDYDREAKTVRLQEGCELLLDFLYYEGDS